MPSTGARVVVPPAATKQRDAGAQKPRLSVQDQIAAKFREKGFTTNQLAKAIFVHEILGVCLLALTWSSCYRWPPSQHPLLKEPVARMLAAVPNGISKTFESNGFLNSRLGSAYIESSCCRKLIRPLTLPGKMFVTFKVVEAWSRSGTTSPTVASAGANGKRRALKFPAFLAPPITTFSNCPFNADIPLF